jgi:hypothetical protein
MKERDLIIGCNYYHEEYGGPREVVLFDAANWYRIGDCVDREENYSGIELSDDVLLRCGFKYRNEHRGQGAILDLHNENWKKGMSVAFMKDGILRVLNHPQFDYKYLHQLQNLHYALTEDDLIYKL